MRTYTIVLFAAALLTAAPPALAQSGSPHAGWVALVTTPAGGFAPDVPATGPMQQFGGRARYGHWQFAEDDDNTTDLALGLSFGSEAFRLTVDVGRSSEKDRDDRDAFMLGLEFERRVLDRPLGPGAGSSNVGSSRLGVFLRPAVGYMRESDESDFSTLSLALSVPVSLSFAIGERGRIVPFVAPAMGGGVVSRNGDSETGSRLMLGGGLGLVDLVPGLRISGGFQKIFIEGAPTVLGVTVGFGR